MTFRPFLSFVAFVAAALCPGPLRAQEGGRVESSLEAKAAAVPGKSFDVALKLVHPGKLHTYGPRTGDAGLPTTIEWKLPDGWTAAAPRWAASSQADADIYEGTVEHLTAISVPVTAKADAIVKLEAETSWLECDDKGCLPVRKTLTMAVKVTADAAPAPAGAAAPAEEAMPEKDPAAAEAADPFEEAEKEKAADAATAAAVTAEAKVIIALNTPPAPVEAGKPFELTLRMTHSEGYHSYGPKTELEGQSTTVKWTLPEGWKEGTPRWAKANYPKAGEFDVYTGEVEHVFPLTPPADAAAGSEHKIKAVLSWQQCTEFTCEQLSREIEVQVKIGDKATAVQTGAASAGSRFNLEDAFSAVFTPGQPDYLTLDGKIEEKPNLGTAIFFAFIGGMILNLMPCVFPVLGIKVLGFVKLGGNDPAKIRMHGFVFGIGVILSLLALAGTLLIIQAASGSAQGWGFLQQSAGFTAGITLLMVVLGLNLAGVFEIGGSLSNVGGQLQGSRKGYTGSFMSGVLTTMIATPCSGPFLGAAIGYAFAQPPAITLGVFFFFGLGIAAPYILLSCFPAFIRRLPKPGAWMETFKKAMSFLMFATAVFFLHTFAAQAGEYGRTLLLLSLVLAGITVWIYGHWCAAWRSKLSRTGGLTAALAFAALTYWPARSASLQKSELSAANERADLYVQALGELKTSHPALKLPEILTSTSSDEVVWQDFTPDLVRDLRKQGRMIYMDFTANWCAVCKTNKALCFELKGSEGLRSRMKELNVAFVRVSFDSPDEVYNAVRNRLGRNTIPVNLIYPPGGAVPRIFPDGILTPDAVLEGIEKAAKAGKGA